MWHDLIVSDAVGVDQAVRVDVDGHAYCVARCGDTIHVVDDTCTHEDESLSDGDLWPGTCEIECPKHSSSFSLESGVPQCLPATQPLRVYPAREVGGVIQADLG